LNLQGSIDSSFNVEIVETIVADAVPVLPLVASINLSPFDISSFNSRCDHIVSGTVFTLPPGLSPSSFNKRFTFSFLIKWVVSMVVVILISSADLWIFRSVSLYFNFSCEWCLATS